MDVLDLLCLIQDCFVVGFWATVILISSALLAWFFILRGGYWASPLRRHMAGAAFIEAALFQSFFVLALWHWYSYIINNHPQAAHALHIMALFMIPSWIMAKWLTSQPGRCDIEH